MRSCRAEKALSRTKERRFPPCWPFEQTNLSHFKGNVTASPRTNQLKPTTSPKLSCHINGLRPLSSGDRYFKSEATWPFRVGGKGAEKNAFYVAPLANTSCAMTLGTTRTQRWSSAVADDGGQRSWTFSKCHTKGRLAVGVTSRSQASKRVM